MRERRDGFGCVRQPVLWRVATLRSKHHPSAAGSVVARVSAGFWMDWRIRFRGHEPNGSERRRVYRSRYECDLVVPPTPEHSPDAFLISTFPQDHN